MTKSKAGRPGKIDSEHPLQRVSTRISVEAIAIIDAQDNKAKFIDEAVKKAGCQHTWGTKSVNGKYNNMEAICIKCGASPIVTKK